jgi:hypothetical protein
MMNRGQMNLDERLNHLAQRMEELFHAQKDTYDRLDRTDAQIEKLVAKRKRWCGYRLA